MSLREVVTPTAVARAGMTVAELFAECIRTQVPGIPYIDADGKLAGKASIRHVLKVNCMPDYLVKHSHVLGDAIDHVRFPEIHCHEVMARVIDDMLLEDIATINVDAPVSKALARMEQHDTTYIFVLDVNGDYLGAISIIQLAGFLYDQAKRS